jgi:hypothetical protein
MKKSFLIMVALVSFTTFAFAGGDQNQNRHDGELGEGPTNQVRIDNPNQDTLQVRQLTDEQKEIIYEIYEEEKLARDVYRTLGDMYPEENTFANIQLSEQTHMDAVRNLCDKHGIEIKLDSDPGGDETGVFTISRMQDFYATVYEDFVYPGTGSLLDALNVGIQIETMDIDDLGSALVGMPKDVVKVFNNLISGSVNHLDAFTTAIERETSQ